VEDILERLDENMNKIENLEVADEKEEEIEDKENNNKNDILIYGNPLLIGDEKIEDENPQIIKNNAEQYKISNENDKIQEVDIENPKIFIQEKENYEAQINEDADKLEENKENEFDGKI